MGDLESVLDVLILSPEKVLFQGKAESVILPGEKGVFELLPHHKGVISKLLSGRVVVNNKWVLPIKRGVIKAGLNKVTLIIEENE